MLGQLDKDARPLIRSGAKPAQKVFVTGFPGESGVGFHLLMEDYEAENKEEYKRMIQRHLKPMARVLEGNILAKSAHTGGAIDISDGLYSELKHLTEESSVKIDVNLEQLPVSDDLRKICDIDKDENLDIILFGGEDYELLFTSSASLEDLESDFRNHGSDIEIHEIGRVSEGAGVHYYRHGKEVHIKDKTYQHFM